MRAGKGEAGYVLIFLVFIISALPLMMAFSFDVITQANGVSERMQKDLTLMRMGILKTSVIRHSKDVDRDNYCEPLMDEDGWLPLKMNLVVKDAWDNAIRYCHWDLGAVNTIDPAYSQNEDETDPPVAGLIARLISPGKDGDFQTDCEAASPAGDDYVENIFNSDVRAYFK